jgi:uncharacterized protein Yka (UPF0111/DUF47 family)
MAEAFRSVTQALVMPPERKEILRFVKQTDKALSPVKESAKAAGFDLRRYTEN